jgi:hypothetical protein
MPPVGSLNLYFSVSGQRQNIPIFLHALDFFSGQGDWIELILFAMIQAS